MRRKETYKAVLLILITAVSPVIFQLFAYHKGFVIALPPKEDIPEEILRTEIILEARSPIDGKLLSAAEYAQLQAQLKTRPYPPKLSPKVRETVFFLRLLKILKTLFPFVDF
ncbi:hypothetical protein Riv7116_3338 [Rivularia sp. PCC 7116]|uniref:hypothetical protein n=1 Tax=Rivularia sp. PCC 7116 TaxID=373994 RepID=UPI00029F1AA2|nr:hypothetical protein [Rivularia sp. PCC 7116]AFY55800.1 hypothetical protein Riv7116_3338 [Rivularia sp. PCC 7116]